MAEEMTVKVMADTGPFRDELKLLQDLSASFGSQLTGALKAAAVSGKSLDDVLRRIALNLAGMALNRGLQPLQSLAGSFFSSLFGGITGFAKGGVVPFASGGVVNTPTYFPLGRATGLMGEAGAEAILPLQRSADGRLGVSAGGGGQKPVTVVFNVSTPDAGSFRKSEAQVSAMLARAVGRGSRGL
ncbi:MAG: phage tail tape measure protein [Rhizobiaceae bacterium]|nr:phage tail tape measure protein [Rhizobiaceae bacterium]